LLRGVPSLEAYGRPSGSDGREDITTFQYEDGGREPTVVTRGSGTSDSADWVYTYGPLGELTSVKLPTADHPLFQYKYYADRKLSEIDQPGLDPQTFTYDFLVRVLKRTRGAEMTWSTTYTDGSAQTVDALGDSRTTLLDGLGRPAKTTVSKGPGLNPARALQLVATVFDYDGLGQLVQTQEVSDQPTITSTYEHDQRNRLTAIHRPGAEVSYPSYTGFDAPQRVTTPGGSSVGYTYDGFGRIHGISGQKSAIVSWEAGGARLQSVVSDGLSEVHCYDDRGWNKGVANLASATAGDPCSGGLPAGASVFAYDYDGRGNKLGETYGDPVVNEHISYGYDQADRLTGTQYPNKAVLYELTPYGARQREKTVPGQVVALDDTGFADAPDGTSKLEYSIDTSGRLQGVFDSVTGVAGSIQTDAAGRIGRLKMPGGPDRSFTWDPAGRLLKAVTDGVQSDYRYDFRGWRTQETVNGTTTAFHWGADEFLEEQGPGGTLTYERFDDVVSAIGGQRVLRDGMGSIVGKWNGSQPQNQRRYEPFGQFRTNGTNWTQPTPNEATLAYAGQHYDVTSGLSYAQQRWYAPELGRFLSEDPVGANAERLTRGRNLDGFAYGGGNPGAWIDPTGEFEGSAWTPEERSDINAARAVLWKQRMAACKRGDKYACAALRADPVSAGVGAAIAGVVAPIAITYDLAQMGAATWQTAFTGQPHDVDFVSGFGQRVSAHPDQAARAALVTATAMPTGGGSVLADNIYTVFDEHLSADEASDLLWTGAVAQVTAVGTAMVASKASGDGWTGRAVDPVVGKDTSPPSTRNIPSRSSAEYAASVGDYDLPEPPPKQADAVEQRPSWQRSEGDVANTSRKSTALVKYDGTFAAQQILGEEPTTPGGRSIGPHAAERMVKPPPGRAPMTKSEIDQVLDTGTLIKKVTPHPEGDTVTVQHPGLPGKPQVVVDAATGKRVITVIKGRPKGTP
jgi:RHS repeat-associated protein